MCLREGERLTLHDADGRIVKPKLLLKLGVEHVHPLQTRTEDHREYQYNEHRFTITAGSCYIAAQQQVVLYTDPPQCYRSYAPRHPHAAHAFGYYS